MKLTNKQLFNAALNLQGKMDASTDFKKKLIGIKDFDLQICVRENEEKIKKGYEVLKDSLVASFGTKLNLNDSKVIEVLDKPSTVELSQISITDEQLRSWRPDGEMLEYLLWIRKSSKK